MKPGRGWLVGLALAGALGAVAPVAAQTPVEIRSTPAEPPRRLELVVPGPSSRELTQPRDLEFYGEDQRVPYNPAFVEPLTVTTAGGRVKGGVSAHTAPHTPVGAISIVNPLAGMGALSIGFTVIWDVPPPDAPAR